MIFIKWWKQRRLKKWLGKRNWKDILKDIGIPEKMGLKRPETVYTDEFQDWFASGYRCCHKHHYPVLWHIWQRIDCPRCEQEKEKE